MKFTFAFCLWCAFFFSTSVNAQVYSGRYGKVKFTGSVSGELIIGQSHALQGEIDFESGYVTFEQPLNRFYFHQGEKPKETIEHVLLETEKFPLAFFHGKMVNDFTSRLDNGELPSGTYSFTVAGMLSLHGVDNEVKIVGECVTDENTITLKAQFKIYLSDFGVVLPKLSTQKVSEEVNVSIDIKMGRAAS